MIHALAEHHGDRPMVTAQDVRRDVLGSDSWLTIFVARAVRQELVGYGAVYPIAQLQFGVRGLELHHLYVTPARRGEGIGRRLIAKSVDHARQNGCAYVAVGTDPDNHQAGKVYLAAGFAKRPEVGPRYVLRL